MIRADSSLLWGRGLIEHLSADRLWQKNGVGKRLGQGLGLGEAMVFGVINPYCSVGVIVMNYEALFFSPMTSLPGHRW
jgi:hypothetical protein